MSWTRLLISVSALPLVFTLWSLITLAHNYAKARSTGLPITIRFFTPGSPLWMLFSPLVMRICAYLPFTSTFIATNRRGWEARERCRPHVRLGDLFIIVAPGGNWLKVCNEDLANDILKRKDEFRRDLEAFEVLNIYGKNLATTEGADWNRHRKVAAVTFTEKNNELVWLESVSEGKEMLEFWVRRARAPIRSLAQDARIFTLNVLAAALFDKRYPFESREESGTRDKAFGYRDSLSTILRMIVPILIFGEATLRTAWWLPSSFRSAGFAVADFRTYVTDLINEERVLIAQGKQNSPNLVTNLVRACEDPIDGSIKTDMDPDLASQSPPLQPRRAILTKDEIISDLFVFAFAGNDTTAITLTHLLAFMAAHPQIQTWLSEELTQYLPPDSSSWPYTTCTKLKRCQAIIYETLRLCHPLGQLVKTTGPLPRTLSLNGKTYLIPPRTTVEINLPALQSHPRHWGPDALVWNPKRFITGSSMETEVLPPDTTGFFFPWAFGRNVCPGKRFSQVELVAVLAALFRDHGVEPVAEGRESMEEARRRTERVAQDVEMRLLNEMREPERIAVRWFER